MVTEDLGSMARLLDWLFSLVPFPLPGMEQGLLVVFLGMKAHILINEQVSGDNASTVALCQRLFDTPCPSTVDASLALDPQALPVRGLS